MILENSAGPVVVVEPTQSLLPESTPAEQHRVTRSVVSPIAVNFQFTLRQIIASEKKESFKVILYNIIIICLLVYHRLVP